MDAGDETGNPSIAKATASSEPTSNADLMADLDDDDEEEEDEGDGEGDSNMEDIQKEASNGEGSGATSTAADIAAAGTKSVAGLSNDVGSGMSTEESWILSDRIDWSLYCD